jgi:hypothetical protein
VLGAIKDSDRLLCAEVNITDKASINRVLDSIEAKWGVPDGLVNNAGVDTQPSAPPEVSGPFEEFPEEVFREVVEVNLVGTFLMTQQVGKRMKQAGKGGSIINVGSIYGVVSPVQDIYSYKKRTPAFRSSNRWPIRRQSPGCITLPATAPPTGARRHSRQYSDPLRRRAQRSGPALPEKLHQPYPHRADGESPRVQRRGGVFALRRLGLYDRFQRGGGWRLDRMVSDKWQVFRGIISAVVTPMHADESVNYAALDAIARAQLARGLRALLLRLLRGGAVAAFR